MTKDHNSRRKFLWNPQLSKGHMGLFPDIFSVKEAIGENNYVTIYNHLCHCLVLLSNLYFESYSFFVGSTGGIFGSWCKGKKGRNRVIEGMGCRADSQVRESRLGTCWVSLLFRLACVRGRCCYFMFINNTSISKFWDSPWVYSLPSNEEGHLLLGNSLKVETHPTPK